MNSELRQTIRKEWVAALRSGKYTQTRGRLRRVTPGTMALKCGFSTEPPGHCCLGVLCEVLKEHGMGDWNTMANYEGEFLDELSSRSFSVGALNPSLRKSLGLPIDAMDYLMQMNDVYAVAFPAIADYIENIPWEDGGHEQGTDEEDKVPWDPDHATPETKDDEE